MPEFSKKVGDGSLVQPPVSASGPDTLAPGKRTLTEQIVGRSPGARGSDPRTDTSRAAPSTEDWSSAAAALAAAADILSNRRSREIGGVHSSYADLRWRAGGPADLPLDCFCDRGRRRAGLWSAGARVLRVQRVGHMLDHRGRQHVHGDSFALALAVDVALCPLADPLRLPVQAAASVHHVARVQRPSCPRRSERRAAIGSGRSRHARATRDTRRDSGDARPVSMKGTSRLLVLAVALCEVGCSSSNSRGAARPLTLYTGRHQIIAQLSPDGTITDSTAKVITRYDPRTESMSLNGATLNVGDSVDVTGARELAVYPGPLGPWQVRVTVSDDLVVDGRPFGHVEGLEDSRAGLFRLGALLCAVPVIHPPAPPSPPADAALPPDADLRPAPPPPPPPRIQRGTETGRSR